MSTGSYDPNGLDLLHLNAMVVTYEETFTKKNAD